MTLSVAVCVTLSLLTAAPETKSAVLVTRRTAFTREEADATSRSISKELVAQRVLIQLDADGAREALARLGLQDSSACAGRKKCISELGRQLGVTWVIALSLARVGADQSIGIELIKVSDGSVSEKEALVLPKGTTPSLAAFAGKLRAVVGEVAPTPAPEPDRPVAVVTPPKPELTPVVTPPPQIIEPPPKTMPRSHAPQFVMGGVAVASLVAGTALIISGASARSEAFRVIESNGVRQSPYSASEVRARAENGNVQLGIGGALGAVAVGLGATAVITW